MSTRTKETLKNIAIAAGVVAIGALCVAAIAGSGGAAAGPMTLAFAGGGTLALEASAAGVITIAKTVAVSATGVLATTGVALAVGNGKDGNTVNEPKNVQRQAKQLSREAKQGYDKAIDALKSGDMRGLNDHPLSGNRSGQRAIDIKGMGRGRGAGRIIYEVGKDGIINIIEILTKHNY